jgi:hypothetical protein
MAKTKARAKRRYFGKARKSFHKKPTISLAIAAGFAVPVTRAVNTYKYAGLTNAVSHFTSMMVGFEPTTGLFNANNLKSGLLPVMTGAVIHKVASMMGINRMIAQSGIPFIRI